MVEEQKEQSQFYALCFSQLVLFLPSFLSFLLLLTRGDLINLELVTRMSARTSAVHQQVHHPL